MTHEKSGLFIWENITIDAFSSETIVLLKITSLRHKPSNNPEDIRLFIVVSKLVFTCDYLAEVLYCFGNTWIKQLKLHLSELFTISGNLHKSYRITWVMIFPMSRITLIFFIHFDDLVQLWCLYVASNLSCKHSLF